MIESQSCFVDLSMRTKLRITGSDRLRFLNGQITNDVRKATETNAIEACVINPKGKINAHIFVSLATDCFFVDTDPELREGLAARLEKYVIADDVQVEDVTDRLSIFHVLARSEPKLSDCRILSVRRFNEQGWDVWADATTHDSILERLSHEHTLLDPAAAEVLRIEQGIPRWGRELTEQIIPVEANLEERTIDYEKGCYIGQEVISRIKMAGQTNKRLCGLTSAKDIPLQPGTKLSAPHVDGKETGWITSATYSAKMGKEIALGYIRRGFTQLGTELDASSPQQVAAAGVPVKVVRLPFVD